MLQQLNTFHAVTDSFLPRNANEVHAIIMCLSVTSQDCIEMTGRIGWFLASLHLSHTVL